MNSGLLDHLSRTINQILPPEVVKQHGENLRAALQSLLERLDLVSREELEVQEAVLERTRQRLEDLERKVATLEAKTPKKE